MERVKYSKDECIEIVLKIQNELGDNHVITDRDLRKNFISSSVRHYWSSIDALRKDLGLPNFVKYTEKEIIDSYVNYAKKNGYFPSFEESKKIWEAHNLPNPYYIHNKYRSWISFMCQCDYIPNHYIKKDGKLVKEYDNPDFLKQLVLDITKKLNRRPKRYEIEEEYGIQLSKVFKKHFGSYNNCLKELDIIPQSRKYTDAELEEAFMRFVNQYHRTPSCNDFIYGDYPSHTVYQDRFGSWVNACIHYGFKPNCRKPEYYLENGERCDSRYEVDVSRWFLSNNIKYTRNIPYTNIDNYYKGKMNCDYKITDWQGNIWYIEVVGFINSLYETKYTSEQQIYMQKLLYKKKLLERSCCNYRFLFRKELETKTLDELMSFLL